MAENDDAKSSGKLGRITADRTRLETTCSVCGSIIGIVFDRRAVERMREYESIGDERGSCWCGEPFFVSFDGEGHAVELESGLPKQRRRRPISDQVPGSWVEPFYALTLSREAPLDAVVLNVPLLELLTPDGSSDVLTAGILPFTFDVREIRSHLSIVGAGAPTIEESAFLSELLLSVGVAGVELARYRLADLIDGVPFQFRFEPNNVYTFNVRPGSRPFSAPGRRLRVALMFAGQRTTIVGAGAGLSVTVTTTAQSDGSLVVQHFAGESGDDSDDDDEHTPPEG